MFLFILEKLVPDNGKISEKGGKDSSEIKYNRNEKYIPYGT